MRIQHPVILSSIVLFLLSFLPAALGFSSFYRFETITLLLATRETVPDFSIDSFLNIWQTNLHGYYRPGGYILWSISDLIAGKSPFVLQIMQATVYALISVSLYLSGRFFTSEFAGWAVALIFAYLEPLVVLSWWTGTLDGFFGMLCYVIGLNLFLYTPFRPIVTVVISSFFFGLGIFTKEIFIPLSIFLPLFVFTVPKLKSGTHRKIAVVVILLCGLKLILQSYMGSYRGDHIVGSISEINFILAFQNYVDYGRLYLYGHNILLIGLCLIRPNKDESKDPNRLTGLLVVLLAVYLASHILATSWLIDVYIVLTIPYFFIHAQNYERIWMLWILGGLSLVMVYDIRIIGGIMNRRVMEPSIGFALFTGCALSTYPAYIQHRLATFSWPNFISFKHLARIIWQRLDIVCLALLLTIGFRQEIVTSGIMREWRYWIAEGEVLRNTLYRLDEILPPDAHLLADVLPGIQNTHQINDALAFLFNRQDVQVFDLKANISETQLRQTHRYSPLFVLTTTLLSSEFSILFSPLILNTFTDTDSLVQSVYLYRLQRIDR